MMMLPEPVKRCLEALEAAGFPCYAVGGCVRDALLGLIPHDYDLCTAATPEQTEAVFSSFPLVLAGKKHGTVGVVTDDGVVEITTFRTEGGYRDNRHPDWVRFVPAVEEDLARRDFTVNAMAWSPTRGLQDPFGGGDDLKAGLLRAVGDAPSRFREDSLRILRGVRFAVRYGLTPEPETARAMTELAPLMENLAAERVFEELCKLIVLANGEDLLRFSSILTQVIPELAPTVGFAQHSPHHAFDVFTHTAYVTQGVPREPALRWAALLHDAGKPQTFTLDETGRGHFLGHAKAGAQIADRVLLRLKAPTALRERVVLLIDRHMLPLEPDRKLLRRQLSRYGADALLQILALQQADLRGKGVSGQAPEFEEIRRLIEEILAENACLSRTDLAVSGYDLMALGLSGKAIGAALNDLLEQVLDERLPNEKTALLEAAKKITL